MQAGHSLGHPVKYCSCTITMLESSSNDPLSLCRTWTATCISLTVRSFGTLFFLASLRLSSLSLSLSLYSLSVINDQIFGLQEVRYLLY